MPPIAVSEPLPRADAAERNMTSANQTSRIEATAGSAGTPRGKAAQFAPDLRDSANPVMDAIKQVLGD